MTMAQYFRWMWVIIEPCEVEDGYLLGWSDVYYTTRAECVAAARIWIETADYDMCILTRGPYLIVQSVNV